MAKITKHYRNEWKYQISLKQTEEICRRLNEIMEFDSHGDDEGYYFVRSLYFDDLKNTCARENIAGERERFKYRIRYYGSTLLKNRESKIFLERKEKYNSFCHKDSCVIAEDECKLLMEGDIGDMIFDESRPLLQRFCTDILVSYFEPKAIVEYERRAYVESISNVRVTFDRNISASNEVEHFLDGRHLAIPLIKGDEAILEVKHDAVLPSYIRNAVEATSFTQQAFSKYYQSRVATK